MSPTPEGSARAKKAWVTIRKKKALAAAEAVKAKEAASELLEAADAKETTFSLERDLQAALRTNIEQLGGGLTIHDGGKEKRIPSGFIDILALDSDTTQ